MPYKDDYKYRVYLSSSMVTYNTDDYKMIDDVWYEEKEDSFYFSEYLGKDIKDFISKLKEIQEDPDYDHIFINSIIVPNRRFNDDYLESNYEVNLLKYSKISDEKQKRLNEEWEKAQTKEKERIRKEKESQYNKLKKELGL